MHHDLSYRLREPRVVDMQSDKAVLLQAIHCFNPVPMRDMKPGSTCAVGTQQPKDLAALDHHAQALHRDLRLRGALYA